MPEACPPSAAKLEISQPRLFGLGAVLVVNGYGVVLVVPVLVAGMVMSLFKIGLLLCVLIPLLAIALTAFFLPFGLGNPHVTRLVRSLHPATATSPDDFIVQVTLEPRLQSGLRALIEDADDVGRLSFTASELVFQGDALQFTVPFEQVAAVRQQNIGLRGLFVYRPRIAVVLSGLPQLQRIEFAERFSWLLPTSRQITKRLFQHLNTALDQRARVWPSGSDSRI